MIPESKSESLFRIQRLTIQDAQQAGKLLVALQLEEQVHYPDHPVVAPDELEAQACKPIETHFIGENLVFGAFESDRMIGLCWCVLYDPGNGLEGEVAELYVEPQWRGRGVAQRLLAQAVDVFRSKQVTFACVWTRNDNPAALSAYRNAGFVPTSQMVLTWDQTT